MTTPDLHTDTSNMPEDQTITPDPRPINRRYVWLLCAMLLLLGLTWLIGSGYWAAWKLKRAFTHGDIAYVQAHIPAPLLTHLVPIPEAVTEQVSAWQGAGHNYLQQVLPQLYASADVYGLLMMRTAQMLSDPTTPVVQHYAHFPNIFVLEIGRDMAQLRITLTQHAWLTWQVTNVCSPTPSADLVASACGL